MLFPPSAIIKLKDVKTFDCLPQTFAGRMVNHIFRRIQTVAVKYAWPFVNADLYGFAGLNFLFSVPPRQKRTRPISYYAHGHANVSQLKLS